MAIEELLATFKGVRDVRQGLDSIKRSSESSASSFDKFRSTIGGLNSAMAAARLSMDGLEKLGVRVDKQTADSVRGIQETLHLAQQASDVAQLLPAGLSVAAIPLAVFAAIGLLTKAQFDAAQARMEKRINGEIDSKTRQLVDVLVKPINEQVKKLLDEAQERQRARDQAQAFAQAWGLHDAATSPVSGATTLRTFDPEAAAAAVLGDLQRRADQVQALDDARMVD